MAASGIFVEAFQGMFIDIVRFRSREGQEQESYDALQSILKNNNCAG
jgi:adenosylmethionine-8-amino-7-oxononanoate aminotransferase